MSNRYQTILFDLDSTLIDNVEAFRRILPKMAEEYPPLRGHEELLFRIYFNFANGSHIFEDICWELHWNDAPPYPAFLKHLWDLYIHATVCFPWTVSTLTQLKKRGCKLGIITNGDAWSQNVKIDTAGFRDDFDIILISKAIGFDKPDPRIYELAIEQLGAAKETTLFVGDNPRTDILGAKNAGIDSFLISREENRFGATYIGSNISKILNLI